MNEIDYKKEELVEVFRVERRSKTRKELTCEEVMELARKRGSKSPEAWERLPPGALPQRRK